MVVFVLSALMAPSSVHKNLYRNFCSKNVLKSRVKVKAKTGFLWCMHDSSINVYLLQRCLYYNLA